MKQQPWLRRHWKLVLNIFTFIALAVVIVALHKQLGATFSNLARVNGWLLLLLIPIEALNYHAQAKVYQRLFRIVGNNLTYKSLLRTSLELNFVNHVFPSGGAAGISYFGLSLRDGEKLTAAKATLVHVMKLGLQFLSFELVIVFGLLSLAIMGHVSNIVILVAAVLSTLLLVGTFGFGYIVGSQARINHFFTGLTVLLNKLIQVVRPRHPETINIDKAKGVFDDFHKNYKEIRNNYRQLQAPFWWALLANATEVLAVYVVYLAFDQYVNIGAVIIAYAVANFAGLVSIAPGGAGVYEGLMIAVMASAGVSAGVTIPVVVMYRVLNTLIQVPPGYYLYQRTLRKGHGEIHVTGN